MTARIVVLVSGGGSNLAAVLDACSAGRIAAKVVAVVSNRQDAYALTRAAGAGLAARYVPLGPYTADGRGRRAYDADLAAIVAGYRPDWVLLAGWMHLLSSAFLDVFPDRVVNLHPALPGWFPGAHAIDDAFAAFTSGQITHTGVMVHLVPDEGVDDGPVLATVEVPIHPDDTLADLEARMHEAEHRLLVETLSVLCQNCSADLRTTLDKTPQPREIR